MKENSRILLLVEDDKVTALFETKMLEGHGFNVIIARSGEDAIEILKKRDDIDLVLMDIDLGDGMDGTVAARIILRDYDLPIVFLSSHTEPEIVMKTDRITSYGYVVKNTGETVLMASIKMAFRLFDAYRDIHRHKLEIEAANEELQAGNDEMVRSRNALEEHQNDLRKSEGKVRSIIENLPLGIHQYHLELDGRLVFEGANSAADRILGVDNSTFIGLTIEEAFPNLAGSEVPVRYAGACSEGTSWHTEQIVYEDDSIKGAFEVDAFQTGPRRMVAMFSDITARKVLEERMLEKEEKFKLFLEHSPIYVFFKDADIRAVALSRNFENFTGMPVEKMIGKTMDELFPSDMAKKMIEDDKKIFIEGKPFEVIEELDGRVYSTLKFPIYRKDDPYLLAGFTMDITESTRAKEALGRALEEKNALYMELQHRVKNSFFMIMSMIDLEIDQLADDDSRKVILETRNRIHSLSKIYDILHLTGEVKFVHLANYFEHLCLAIAESFHVQKKIITLELDLGDVIIDVKRAISMGLILNELFTNSLKYAFPAGRKGTIRVTLKRTGNEIFLEVSDDGVGFDDDVWGEVSGRLGHRLVKLLAQQVDGRLIHRCGKGAYFSITIPDEG